MALEIEEPSPPTPIRPARKSASPTAALAEPPSITRGHPNFHFERSRCRYTVVDRLDGDGIGLRPATGGFDLRSVPARATSLAVESERHLNQLPGSRRQIHNRSQQMVVSCAPLPLRCTQLRLLSHIANAQTRRTVHRKIGKESRIALTGNEIARL